MSSEMREIFHKYLDSYSQRNFKSLNQILSKKLSGFGTGEDENTFDIDFRDLYKRDFVQIPKGLTFTIYNEDYHVLSTTCFIALAIFDISAEINGMPHTLFSNRLSCVFHKSVDENNEWKIVHMHLSAPLPIQEDGESAPIKELQRQNQELERLVKLKTQELLSINETLSQKNAELVAALEEVKTLQGLIPICANCKKMRNDAGYWQEIEEYFDKNTDVKLTHSLCDECVKKLYPDMDILDSIQESNKH